MPQTAVGIFRETLHSPEREFDDLEILRLTGRRLSEQGLNVILKKPEEALEMKELWALTQPDLFFVMCEQEKILAVLESWEKKGAALVNRIEGILNTYRHRMTPLLKSSKISMPKSELVSTFKPVSGVREIWVKRGDVHNTQKGDVFFAKTEEEVNGSLKSFHSRGIAQAVLQEHVAGDLVKFYGIGDPSGNGSFWFKWFYHKNQDLKKHPFSEAALKTLTRGAARRLGLEVFGGDAIISADGRMVLIDINAWPSFALFRDEASLAISDYLLSKLKLPVR